MNQPTPITEVQTNLPSRATVGGSILGGIGLAPLIVWLLGQFGVAMPGEVAAIVGGLISNLVGYFFEGGRAYKPVTQSGFARPSLLALLAIIVLAGGALAGCQGNPARAVQVACDRAHENFELERCAKSIAETWEVYQVRAEELVTDPLTPIDVKRGAQRAEAVTRPAVVEMLKATAFYSRVKQDLAAGVTEEEKLRIANENLDKWVQQTLPLIASMRAALGL